MNTPERNETPVIIHNENAEELETPMYTMAAVRLAKSTEKPCEDYFYLRPTVMIGCDGVGGKKGGDVAASLVAHRLGNALESIDSYEAFEEFFRGEKIVEIAKDIAGQVDTTFVAVKLFPDGSFASAHVGDTRLYELYEEWDKSVTLNPLTKDHNIGNLQFEGYPQVIDCINHAIDTLSEQSNLPLLEKTFQHHLLRVPTHIKRVAREMLASQLMASNVPVDPKKEVLNLKNYWLLRNVITASAQTPNYIVCKYFKENPQRKGLLITTDGIHDQLCQAHFQALVQFAMKEEPENPRFMADELILEAKNFYDRPRKKIGGDDVQAIVILRK